MRAAAGRGARPGFGAGRAFKTYPSTGMLMHDNQPDAPRATDAGKWLAIVATVAITLLFSLVFFSLLRTGRHCAIQDIFHGDNDAAALKIFGVAFVYAGVALLLSRLNKRLGFYPVLGATAVLIGVAVVYGFPLAVVPAIALAIASLVMWKRRYHAVPINRWLAIGVSIPGALATLIAIAKLRIELFHWSLGAG